MAVLADGDVIVHGNVAMLTIALVIRTSAASGSSEGRLCTQTTCRTILTGAPDDVATDSGGRRTKSSKGGNRDWADCGGAAGAMGI